MVESMEECTRRSSLISSTGGQMSLLGLEDLKADIKAFGMDD